MPGGGEKSEQATPKRRQKAREKGNVPKSAELTAAASMLGIILVMYFGGAFFIRSISGSTGRLLSFKYGIEPFIALRAAEIEAARILLPFLLAALFLAIASEVGQVGFLVKNFELSLDRLNPLAGIQRLFSSKGLVDFLKSFFKFLAGGVLVYLVVTRDMHKYPLLMTKELNQLASAAADHVLRAVLYGFFYLLIIALISYFLNRWSHERSLRMTKEEVKEEFKESEGDPKIKSRIRGIQREMARKRMMAEVPKATVIITNPTHLAIALRYKEGETLAPKVIAKGSGSIAAKIREVARTNSIPIVEDRPLARMLFQLEIDTYIPPDLYKAVAKILAYIYKLKRPR